MQARSEETRLHLLHSALELFSKSGYEATGVADICRAAGVSKGAFYHHFTSKQALFMQLLQDWLAALKSRRDQVIATNQPLPQLLKELGTMLPIIFEDAGGRLPMFLEFWIQASRDPDIWQATVAPYREYQQFFAALIEQGVTNGTLKTINPQSAAHVLVALAVGLLLQGLLDPGGDDWGLITQEGIQFLLHGIAREPA